MVADSEGQSLRVMVLKDLQGLNSHARWRGVFHAISLKICIEGLIICVRRARELTGDGQRSPSER